MANKEKKQGAARTAGSRPAATTAASSRRGATTASSRRGATTTASSRRGATATAGSRRGATAVGSRPTAKTASSRPAAKTASSRPAAGRTAQGRAAKAAVDSRSLAASIKSVVDNVTSAIMMVDRDFVVTYANQTTMQMLTQHGEAFRQLWPSFDGARIVGTCIDMFHRNPGHQRQLLNDPKRLPYRTDIAVGPLKFALTVSAIIDDKGQYTGNILEWADVTEARQQQAISLDQANQLSSISKYQAIIEFKLDGTIVTANENFLAATGYTLAEIQGKHHSIFVEPAYRSTPEYRHFWEKLGRGEADGGQYRRFRKDGGEVWLQASYNPILDAAGKPAKVIKYATDITEAKRLEQATERAMKEAARVILALAAGDLRETMEGEFVGEFATLRDALNGCIDNLRDMVAQIRSASGVISSSAGEIEQGNTDLSSRTEQQAASIEETAASMEELTSTVKQNADNARQANQLAGGAREQAEKGGTVVGSAIAAMGSINDASKRIADIIGVIDEIAFQTNLLALNAAVEAARAGEQGRGFAVVAAEVRNLAQRSAGAAKEIKTLIKDSVAKVEEGSRLVNDSGSTLEQIVQSVKKVSDIIAEIAEASAEQSTGIERISDAVSQMDKAVQQNASLVEEATAASGAMADQARNLQSLVSFFKTGDEEEAGAKAAPGKAPGKTAAPAPRSSSAAPANARTAGARPAGSRPASASERPARPAASGGSSSGARRSAPAAPAPAEAELAAAGAGRWEEF